MPQLKILGAETKIQHSLHPPPKYVLKKKIIHETFLVVQWLRICLATQGTQFNLWSRN